jgi:hypothetical protein
MFLSSKDSGKAGFDSLVFETDRPEFQLKWVFTNSFLPTFEQNGWCCHATGLFLFSD